MNLGNNKLDAGKNVDFPIIKLLYLKIYFHILYYNCFFKEEDVWTIFDQNDTDMKDKLLK